MLFSYILFLLIILQNKSVKPLHLTDKCFGYSGYNFWEMCGGCGLCQHLQFGERTEKLCDYTYMDKVFVPESGRTCRIVDSCHHSREDGCGTLPCVPLLGTFKCSCNSTRIGRLCQNNLSKGMALHDYAVVENFLYTPYFVLNNFLTISLTFSSLGSDLKIAIETLTERLVYNRLECRELDFSRETDFCENFYPHHKQFCSSSLFQFNNVKWVFTAKIPFPGRAFVVDSREYVRGGNLTGESSWFLGMLEPVRLTVHNRKDTNPVFETEFSSVDLFTSPQFSVCEPLAIIREGGQTLFEITKMHPGKEIVIETLYRMPPWERDCISQIEDLNIEWKLWMFDVNHREVDEQSYFMKKLQVQFIELEKFTMKPAIYKIRSNVTIWENQKEGFSTAYSYFEVVLLELEPTIQGGYSRSLYHKNHKLILNGSLSRNPNLNMEGQKEDLQFYWECDKSQKLCLKTKTDENYIAYNGPFDVGQTYKFTLTIVSKMFNIVKKASQNIITVSDPSCVLDIICRRNCGGFEFISNPGEPTYLEVLVVDIPVGMKMNKQFTWDYKSEKDQTFQNADKIKQQNTPDNVMIVLANTLSKGETYHLRVKGGSDNPGMATFQLKMAAETKSFSCNVKKKFVEKGDFFNTITCDRLLFDNLSPTYEYYDRFPESDTKGRLLGSKKTNFLSHVTFIRGKLVVEVTNRYGVMASSETKLDVSQITDTTEVVKNLADDFLFYDTTMDPDYKANVISAVVDIIIHEIEKFPTASTIIESLLVAAKMEKVCSFTNMKMWTLAMDLLATDGERIELTPSSVLQLSKIAVKLSDKLNYYLKSSSEIFHDFTSSETLKLGQSMINICSRIYLSKTDLVDDEFYTSFRESTENNFHAIETVMSSLKQRMLPFMQPFIVEGKHIKIWLKEDSPHSFSKLSFNKTSSESIPHITVSKSLANYLNHLSNLVTVQVVVFDKNPFWWFKKLVINTNVVDLKLSLVRDKSEEYVTQLHYPVQINLDYGELETVIINGTVKQPGSNASLESADLAVAIHKIRVEERGRLKLRFMGLKEGESIKVLALYNRRPDYILMREKGLNVTQFASEYEKELLDPTSEDVYDLYYLGIIPGQHIQASESMNYSFEITILRCVSWHYKGWTSRGCDVKDILPDSNQLICECEHLSSFAGFAGVPINTINLCEDYKLFLNVIDNPFVVVIIVCILIMYFIILIYAVRKDRRDKYKQCAIYLEDNLPFDKYPYLVCVHTGARMFAGTTSNVGIMVEGDLSVSRPHVLKSTKFKALERANDNWFVMFTPSHLGEIRLIHIWVDYSGHRPEWYCNKVIVVDLTEQKDYTFLINSWFSLRWDDHVERFEKVTTLEDSYRDDVASDNLIYGFRESHLWASVISKHPRSGVTSSQRLSLAFCGLFAAMLTSCMFYKVFDQQLEDYSRYNIEERELLISVYSMIISSIITNTVTSLFRKHLVIVPIDNLNSDELVESEGGQKASRDKDREVVKTGTLLRMTQAVFRLVSKKKFIPVHLQVDVLKTVKKRSRKTICYEVFAWSFCIILIVSSAILVTLYGLKFGKVKSLEWLSCTIMTLAEELFVVSPTKIVTVAVLSGILFAKIYQVTKYDIDWKTIVNYKRHLLKTKYILLEKLIFLRSSSVYAPLSFKDLSKKQERQQRKDEMWMLLDVIVVGALAMLLIVQSSTLWTTRYYWNNLPLKHFLKKTCEEDHFQLHRITNISDYLPFLERKIFPKIYMPKWYNSLQMGETNSSEVSRTNSLSWANSLLGLPRLRQRRQTPGLCRANVYRGLPELCPNKLSDGTEDKALYCDRWRTTGSYDKFVLGSPWDYKQSPGGYTADLGLTQAATEDVINYLNIENWLDKLTSEVHFEMTLYNPNTGTLSTVAAVTERLYIGNLLNRFYVHTISQEYTYPAIDFILLVSLLTFIFRVILVFNRRGIKNVIVNFWNLFQLLIVCLSVYCAVLYVKNIKYMKDCMEAYTRRDKEEYFDYSHLTTNLYLIQVLIMLLVIMIACMFIKTWRFGNIFEVFFYTMLSFWHSLLWLLVLIILIILVYWTSICYLINNFVLSRTFLIIVHKLDFKHTAKNCTQLSCKLSLFVLCVISDVFTLLIVMHYSHIYRKTKNRRRDKDVLNLCTIFYKRNLSTPRIHS